MLAGLVFLFGIRSAQAAPPERIHGRIAVEFPASSPYATAVGGTKFNEGAEPYWQAPTYFDILSSARSYIPEKAWNDSDEDGLFSATGGGGGAGSTTIGIRLQSVAETVTATSGALSHTATISVTVQ